MIRLEKSPVYLEGRVSTKARRWRNRPEVSRWCRQYSDITPAAHKAWLHWVRGEPKVRMFTVVSAQRHEDVGVCGLTSIDHVNQSAEFSLYIEPDSHRKGYGKAALETLVQHAFSAFNLHRVWGEVFDGNPAMRLFESLGFKKEGRLRQSYFRDGRYIDTHLISILRDEWTLRSAP